MGKKVLHVLAGLGRGGAQTFIINNMVKMNHDRIIFDFLVREEENVFGDLIEAQGGKVYVTSPFPNRMISNYYQTKLFFERHLEDYCAVHIHANALVYILPILFTKKNMNVKLIVHSHNTKSNVKGLGIIHKINRKLFIDDNVVKVACGEAAGKWFFPNEKFVVLNNAIDTSHFAFSEKKRKDIRKELNIPDDAIILGSIGRIEQAKNHNYMLDVFKEFLKTNNNSYLVIVGDGSLLKKTKAKCIKYGIDKNVVFTGMRSDTDRFYSAFDVFLMPSFFEGLPFTLVEAQAAGLVCIVSQNVTKEVDLTDLIIRIDLERGASSWADEIGKLDFRNSNREKYIDMVSTSGFDNSVSAVKLENLYLSEAK